MPEDFGKNLHPSMGQSTTEDAVPSEALRRMGAVTATDTVRDGTADPCLEGPQTVS